MHVSSRGIAAVALAMSLGCGSSSRTEVAEVASALAGGEPQKTLDPSTLCDPSQPTDFQLTSTNPYFPMEEGRTWCYEGEEDGELVELRITVLAATEVVGVVTTRVIEEREWIDGELVEVSLNYYAATEEGTICYFGEAVDIFEDGSVSHEGAWRADEPGNAPGIIMPPDPSPGVRFQMEVAPGIAEDEGRIVGIGPITVPGGTFEDTIRFREFNPLDGDKGYKVFARDEGLIVDGPAVLVPCT